MSNKHLTEKNKNHIIPKKRLIKNINGLGIARVNIFLLEVYMSNKHLTEKNKNYIIPKKGLIKNISGLGLYLKRHFGERSFKIHTDYISVTVITLLFMIIAGLTYFKIDNSTPNLDINSNTSLSNSSNTSSDKNFKDLFEIRNEVTFRMLLLEVDTKK